MEEKAKQLIELFLPSSLCIDDYMVISNTAGYKNAKLNAIKCVYEIILAFEDEGINSEIYYRETDYWEKVKEEINK